MLERASFAQENILYSLIETSNFSILKQNDLELRVKNGLSQGQAEEMVKMLKDNQTDPILCGRNYSQGDIKRKLSLER